MNFVLPFLAAIGSASAVVVGDEFFINYVNKFLNSSVPPCENFYRHVCPRNMREVDRLLGHGEKLARDWIKEGAKKLEQEEHEYTRLEKLLLSIFDAEGQGTGNLARLHEETLDSTIKEGIDTVQIFWRMLERKQYVTAVPDIHVFAPRELMHEIVRTVEKEIEVSASLYNEKTKQRLHKMLATLNTEKYDEYDPYTYDIVFHKMEIFFNATGALDRFNESNVNDQLEEFLKVMSVYGAGLLSLRPLAPTLNEEFENRTTNFGAFYQPGEGYNYLYFLDPALILSINASIPAKYGSSGYIMGHETYHSILDSEEWTNDVKVGQHSVCLANYMQDVCTEFKEGLCLSGAITYNEDSADMESIQLLFKMMRNKMGGELKNTFHRTKVTNEQMFFYASAMLHCKPEDEDGSINHKKNDQYSSGYDSHSYGIPRANGPLSLMNAFHEAFNCTAGDRMFDIAVWRESCNAFGDPVRK